MKRLLPLTLALVLALSACASSGPPTAETPAPSDTAAAPTQTPAPSAPLVYADYSQLTPYEKPEQPLSKFTRRYAGFTDALIPAEDYGLLIPFPGAVVTRSSEDGWGWMDDYNLYGLMTLDGEIIVDPVLSSAYEASVREDGLISRRSLGCLLLQKVIQDKNGEPVSVAALCARDGSWCTGFGEYIYDWEIFVDCSTANAVPLRKGKSVLAFLDPNTGKELKTVDLSKVLERWPDVAWSLMYNLRYDERYAIFSDDTAHYLFDAETGEARSLEEILDAKIDSPYAAAFSEDLCPVKTASGWGYIGGSGNWVIAPAYERAEAFENGRALVVDQKTGYYAYIDHSGKAIYTFPDVDSITYFGELVSYQRYDGTVQRRYFLDKDLKRVPLPDDFTNPFKPGDWFIQELPDPSPTVPGGWAFWNYKTGVRQDVPGQLKYNYSMEGDYAIFCSATDQNDYTLIDLSTGEATPLGRWSSVYFTQNQLTGETLLHLYGTDGDPSEWRRLNGETLYRSDSTRSWGIGVYGDKVLDAGREDVVTLTDLKTGELLFSWPLRSAAD